MALLLICAWDHCGLRLNTTCCGSEGIHWGCCGGTGRFHWIGVTVESWSR